MSRRSDERAAVLRRAIEDKVAVVTGAGSGIGRALATELVARGATVVVADVDGSAAAEVARELTRAGEAGRAQAVQLDVTDADAVAGVVTGAARDHGRLDLLFNNAGIGVGGEVKGLSAAHWRRVLEVNLWGVINGVEAAYPLMIEQGFGHIVNTASLSGLLPSPQLVPYSTTKHAVVGLSVGLRVEAAAYGVRVSVVCPGVIETPLLDKGNPDDLPDAGAPDIRAMLTALLGKPYPAPSLAVDVLDGVARNRPIIVSPRNARLAWAVYRLSPGLLIDRSNNRSRQIIRSGGRSEPASPAPATDR